MSNIMRTDWFVARLDTPWMPISEAYLGASGYSQLLLRMIQDARDQDKPGLILGKLNPHDFARLGGSLPQPQTAILRGWIPAALVDLDPDFIANRVSLLWVHPDIFGQRFATAALAKFVPNAKEGGPEMVSARELLTMADEIQSPSNIKRRTPDRIRKRASRAIGRR